MNPPPSLHGAHLRAWQTVFQHPISHNLEWREVHSLLASLGELTEEKNGNLRATRNGQTLVLHPPRGKDVADADELMSLRHFLERSETLPTGPDAAGEQWLLVIDHHEARVFRSEMRGAVPQSILPHAPEDYFRHAPNSFDGARGKERPDPNSFFEPVARALTGTGHVLIFGTGTGMSSEMDQFVAWTATHQPDLNRRIIGAVVVDQHHLTTDQLLAKAREFHAGLPKS